MARAGRKKRSNAKTASKLVKQERRRDRQVLPPGVKAVTLPNGKTMWQSYGAGGPQNVTAEADAHLQRLPKPDDVIEVLGGVRLPKKARANGGTPDATGATEKPPEPRSMAEQYVVSSGLAQPFSMALRMLYFVRDNVRTPGFTFRIPQWAKNELDGYKDFSHMQHTQSLDDAAPYYVSSEVMQIVGSAMQQGPVPDWAMREDGVPTKHGWLWFASPAVSLFSNRGMQRLRQVDSSTVWGSKDPQLMERLDLVCISWSQAYVQIEDVVDGAPSVGYKGSPAPGYSLCYDVRGWWRRGDMPDAPPVPMVAAMCAIPGTDFYQELVTLPSTYNADSPEHGWLVNTGPYKMATQVLNLFEILQTFMGQTMFQHSKRNIDRAERRRMSIPKFTLPPPIHVVTLRKVEYISKTNEKGEPVEWSCHWPVEGHWHKFWVGPRSQPEKRELRSQWVAGYLKGPRDKPFRGHGEKLFNVAR